MASVTSGFMKFFRGFSPVPGQGLQPGPANKRLTRRSSGLGELSRTLASDEPLCVLDIGSTSPTNISYLTGRGHKIYSEDLLAASTDPALSIRDEHGNPTLDSKRFLSENLVFDASQFDVVLCW